MNNAVWITLRAQQLRSFIALTRVTIFVAAVLTSAGTVAHAAPGFNGAGSSVNLGPSGVYDGNSDWGFLNEGNATISGGEYNNNGYGLLNFSTTTGPNSSTASIEAGTFDHNQDDGVDDIGSTDSLSGGDFEYNEVGLWSMTSIDSISGGNFEQDVSGLYANDTTVTISGGNFEHDDEGVEVDAGSTVNISGGNFQDNSRWDLFAERGSTIDLSGEALTFVNPLAPGGTGAGTLDWTLSNGTTEDLSYYAYQSTIEFTKVAAAPESSAAISLTLLIALSSATVLASRSHRARPASC